MKLQVSIIRITSRVSCNTLLLMIITGGQFGRAMGTDQSAAGVEYVNAGSSGESAGIVAEFQVPGHALHFNN